MQVQCYSLDLHMCSVHVRVSIFWSDAECRVGLQGADLPRAGVLFNIRLVRINHVGALSRTACVFFFGADLSYWDRGSTKAGLQADTPVLVGYVEEADQVEGQARSAVCSLAEDLVEH